MLPSWTLSLLVVFFFFKSEICFALPKNAILALEDDLLVAGIPEPYVAQWRKLKEQHEGHRNERSEMLTCQLCKNIVKTFHDLSLVNENWAIVFAKVTCKTLHLQQGEVCSGAVELYGPVILTVFTERCLDPAWVCEAVAVCEKQDGQGEGLDGHQGPGNQWEGDGKAAILSGFHAHPRSENRMVESSHEWLRDADASGIGENAGRRENNKKAFSWNLKTQTVERSSIASLWTLLKQAVLGWPSTERKRSQEAKARKEGKDKRAMSKTVSHGKANEGSARAEETGVRLGARQSALKKRSLMLNHPIQQPITLPRQSDEASVNGEDKDFSEFITERLRLAGETAEKMVHGGTTGIAMSGKLGFFLQLTDIHFDPNYKEGADVLCSRPICCQASDGPGPAAYRQAHRIGEFACDASEALLDAALQFASTAGNLPPLDFVVYTGDTPPHTIWKDTVASTSEAMDVVHGKLKAAFGELPVYPVLGNHGTVPADELVLPPGRSFLTTKLWELWRPWLPNECEATVSSGGYYTVLHEPGLRIVALNTQWMDTMNFWLLNSSDSDPAGQLAWLRRTLEAAERARERVLILGHIPVGDDTSYVYYTKRYIAILERYQSTVMAQLFGHTHYDQFKVYSNDHREPIGVALMAPSLTPFGGHNPAMRLFTYTRREVDPPVPAFLVDYYQYILDLVDAIKADDASHWVLEYQAKTEYGLFNLAPSEWHRLLAEFQDDKRLWQSFLRNFKAQRPLVCDDECQESKHCYLSSTSFAAYQECRGGRVDSVNVGLAVFLNEVMGMTLVSKSSM